MSRSYRKSTTGMHVPIAGAASEKEDKKQWHGALRAHYRASVATATEDSDVLEISPREVSNVWSFAKDGHRFWSNQAQVRTAQRMTGLQQLSEHDVAKMVQRKLHQYRAK